MKTIGYTITTTCALALVLVIGGGVGAQRGNVDWAAVGLSTHHVAGTVSTTWKGAAATSVSPWATTG